MDSVFCRWNGHEGMVLNMANLLLSDRSYLSKQEAMRCYPYVNMVNDFITA